MGEHSTLLLISNIQEKGPLLGLFYLHSRAGPFPGPWRAN